MVLQRQPNKYSCLATAFAMALGVDINEIIKALGHDGSDLLEGKIQRGFHVQELVVYALKMGYAVIRLETQPTMVDGSNRIYLLDHSYVYGMMVGTKGVITGIGKSGKLHSVAWDGEKVFDPNGTVYRLNDFMVHDFFMIIAIR